jgi:hypothetical protein
MLSQDWIGPEFSFISVMNTAPTNGKIPKIKFIVLYLPYRCIMKPANKEPVDIETLFGIK